MNTNPELTAMRASRDSERRRKLSAIREAAELHRLYDGVLDERNALRAERESGLCPCEHYEDIGVLAGVIDGSHALTHDLEKCAECRFCSAIKSLRAEKETLRDELNAVLDASRANIESLRAEKEQAEKKAALADWLRNELQGNVKLRTVGQLAARFVARYDALERESGGTP